MNSYIGFPAVRFFSFLPLGYSFVREVCITILVLFSLKNRYRATVVLQFMSAQNSSFFVYFFRLNTYPCLEFANAARERCS